MKRIIYTDSAGRLCIVTPAYNDRIRPDDDTDEALLARCMARLPADAVNPRITEEDMPADRMFRDAWVDTGGAVDVDMAKARALHMARIRAARNAKLATLDPLWMRAMGRGETAAAAAVEAQRETLRNLPQTFDLTRAADADALKELWPAELNGARAR